MFTVTLLAPGAAVCVSEAGWVAGWVVEGVITDVLALSLRYMKISTALEESLAHSDVIVYNP